MNERLPERLQTRNEESREEEVRTRERNVEHRKNNAEFASSDPSESGRQREGRIRRHANTKGRGIPMTEERYRSKRSRMLITSEYCFNASEELQQR
jgi:ribosomal protein S6E (S10)